MRPLVPLWAKILLPFVLIWLGAFLFFTKDVTSPADQQTPQADGIVILTGTPARLNLGFELLKSGAGKRLLVSGVNSDVSRETLRLAMGESDQLMTCCVDLGRLAQNTVGNAYEASLWAEENGFENLLIVTSAYHMPRSLVELNRQMPNKQLFAVSPANDTLKINNWWKSPKILYVLVAEFNKYLFALFRAHLELVAMQGDPT